MKKIHIISGYTGTCKSHHISDLASEYDLVLGSPTKKVLTWDSRIPREMSYPTSMAFWYSQLYALDVMRPMNAWHSLLMERGLWDYIGYHYVLSINPNTTPSDYKTLDIKGMWKDFLVASGSDEDTVVTCDYYYNDCERLLEVVKSSEEAGRSVVFDDPDAVEFYKKSQNEFLSITKYCWELLGVEGTVHTITEVDF